MIIASLLILMFIAILFFFISIYFREKNYKRSKIGLAIIDEEISNINTVEDCIEVEDKIMSLYPKVDSSLRYSYMARYHMVIGIKYILNKNK